MNNTKKAIFDSAIKIFSMNGYDGATMEDISQNAGVAKGTLYYHFKSKEEIFNFIIHEGLQSIINRTMQIIDGEEGAKNKLLAYCKSQLNLVNEYKDFLKVVLGQLCGENSRNIELRNAIMEYTRDVELYVKQGIENNLIKKDNPLVLSCSILGAVCSFAMYNLIFKDKDKDVQDMDKIIGYLMEGINL